MKQLKNSPGRVFAVALLAAAGLLASATPGLAAEINPVPPLAAAGSAGPAAPADRHPNDGEDPTGDVPSGGWSGGGSGDASDLSDGGDDGDAGADDGDYTDADDVSSDDSTVTGAHKPKKSAAKAKKVQKAADKKAAKAKKSAKKNKKKAAARKKAERAAAKRMEQQAHKAARDAARRSAVADDDGGSGRSGGASLDSVRRAILDLTNRARRQAGCGALRYSSQLEKSAQWMANDMSDKHYMSHTAKNGRDFDQRIRGTGFNGDKTGENLGEGFDSAEGVFRAWMNSPSHRRNILDCKFKILGVGFDPDGGYWAQHFGG